eukprot:gene4728-5902_t
MGMGINQNPSSNQQQQPQQQQNQNIAIIGGGGLSPNINLNHQMHIHQQHNFMSPQPPSQQQQQQQQNKQQQQQQQQHKITFLRQHQRNSSYDETLILNNSENLSIGSLQELNWEEIYYCYHHFTQIDEGRGVLKTFTQLVRYISSLYPESSSPPTSPFLFSLQLLYPNAMPQPHSANMTLSLTIKQLISSYSHIKSKHPIHQISTGVRTFTPQQACHIIDVFHSVRDKTGGVQTQKLSLFGADPSKLPSTTLPFHEFVQYIGLGIIPFDNLFNLSQQPSPPIDPNNNIHHHNQQQQSSFNEVEDFDQSISNQIEIYYESPPNNNNFLLNINQNQNQNQNQNNNNNNNNNNHNNNNNNNFLNIQNQQNNNNNNNNINNSPSPIIVLPDNFNINNQNQNNNNFNNLNNSPLNNNPLNNFNFNNNNNNNNNFNNNNFNNNNNNFNNNNFNNLNNSPLNNHPLNQHLNNNLDNFNIVVNNNQPQQPQQHNNNALRNSGNLIQNNQGQTFSDIEISFSELKIINKLGEGTFGVVYRGTWRGSSVAIKQIKINEDVNCQVLEEFRKELTILSRLRHPNIVLLMAACTTPPNLCFITEYLPGGSFKLKSKSTEMTKSIGSPIWMSPELLMGEDYTEKVDVYAYGIILWELGTGELPYSGLDSVQLALAVTTKGLRPPIPHAWPQSLNQLIQSCWNQDPSKRPSFSQILNQLENLND